MLGLVVGLGEMVLLATVVCLLLGVVRSERFGTTVGEALWTFRDGMNRSDVDEPEPPRQDTL